jgi:hypothetical protein
LQLLIKRASKSGCHDSRTSRTLAIREAAMAAFAKSGGAYERKPRTCQGFKANVRRHTLE